MAREGIILKRGDKYIVRYKKKHKKKEVEKERIIENFTIKDEYVNKRCSIEFDDKGNIKKLAIKGETGDKVLQRVEKTNKFQKEVKKKDGGFIRDHAFVGVGNNVGTVVTNKTKLPKDVRDLNIKNVENFALQFYKFAPWIGGKFSLFHNGNLNICNNFKNIDFTKLNSYYSSKIKEGFKNVKKFNLKTSWRLVVGLGGASVYETSMTLHHIYGFPYIPASAVKGVFRNWVISEIFDLNEKEALQDPVFRIIFGSPEEKSISVSSSKGWVIFFDAFPINEPKIDADVMNPHYSPYYSDTRGKTPPADYHNPIPVYFLTVKDTTFNFMIAVRKNVSLTENSKLIEKYRENNKDNTDNPYLLDVAECLLKSALKEHGIGAKTSVGYGCMTE